MKLFVIVGRNDLIGNTSARAVFSTHELAEQWLADPNRNWFDNATAIIELELDAEAKPEAETVAR